jgi:hypothetical protein
MTWDLSNLAGMVAAITDRPIRFCTSYDESSMFAMDDMNQIRIFTLYEFMMVPKNYEYAHHVCSQIIKYDEIVAIWEGRKQVIWS